MPVEDLTNRLSSAMLVIGLTGGIATGKSTVSSLLKKHEVPVVDADVLARVAVLPGSRGHSQIVKHFGKDVLFADGSLDRKKLGSIIFQDERKRKVLNGIVHPAVRRLMLWEVLKNWLAGKKACVLDVPLLIEASLYRVVGMVVVVHSTEEEQLARLMARDDSSEDDAASRIRSQMPIDEKVSFADVVIENSGSLDELEGQVNALLQRIGSNRTYLLSWLIPPVGLFLASVSLLARNVRSGLVRPPSRKTRL